MKKRVCPTILITLLLLNVIIDRPAYAYMSNLLIEKLTVSNNKIRPRLSGKLIVRPLKNGVQIFIDARGEVDENIKEIFLNDLKYSLSEKQFSIEYPVNVGTQEVRIYGHDDPKIPNYAVVEYKIEKMDQLVTHAKYFFYELTEKMKNVNKQNYRFYLEYRSIPKTKYFEPLLVISMLSKEKTTIDGNFDETTTNSNGENLYYWYLDTSKMEFIINKEFKFSNVDVSKLYPAGVLPWEKFKIEKELGQKLPENIDPKER